MKFNKCITSFLLATCISLSYADTVVYETTFSELPDNWFFLNDWTFGSEGACFYIYTSNNFDATLATGSGFPLGETIFIPDGSESVDIEIETYVHTSGGEGCSTTYTIWLGSSNNPWETVWEFDVPRYQSVYQNFNHSFSPDWLQGGEHLGLMFRIDGAGDDFGSVLEWKIHSLTVTVFGEALALSPDTWAGIKSSLR